MVLLSTFLIVFTVPAMATSIEDVDRDAAIEVTNLDGLYKALGTVKKGGKIKVKGDGKTWYVNKLIFIKNFI